MALRRIGIRVCAGSRTTDFFKDEDVTRLQLKRACSLRRWRRRVLRLAGMMSRLFGDLRLSLRAPFLILRLVLFVVYAFGLRLNRRNHYPGVLQRSGCRALHQTAFALTPGVKGNLVVRLIEPASAVVHRLEVVPIRLKLGERSLHYCSARNRNRI